jgi:hypothetical protein
MKKLIVLVIVIIIALIAFVFVKYKNNYIYQSKDIYFTDKDVYPEIKAELNKQFRINIGQVASFKEGFKVIFIGYDFVLGCAGDSPSGLEEIILKRAEASQCPSSSINTKYAVIKNGVVFEGHNVYYPNGYEITIVSNTNEQERYTDIVVSLLSIEEVERIRTENKNRSLEQKAKNEDSFSSCLEITDKDQKARCTNFIAREAYLSNGFFPSNATDLASRARNICASANTWTDFCSIIGKEKVLTPQMCLDIYNNSSGDSWKGIGFYEDCFAVSMHVYRDRSDICTKLKEQSVRDICLESFKY